MTDRVETSNFKGVDQLERLLDNAKLVVNDRGLAEELDVDSNQLQCDPSSIPILGLDLLPGIDQAAVAKATKKAKLTPGQLRMLVISEDPFLKERDVLLSKPLLEVEKTERLVATGGRRDRSLQNSREGLRIDVVVALGEQLPLKTGRPHRLGTKLAQTHFRIKGYPDASGINPVELTNEIRRTYGLSRKTQIFVEVNEDLLEAETIGEALTVHVDGDLLKALKARRNDLAHDFVSAELAINALQQLAFSLSRELSLDPKFEWGDEEIPVLEFMHGKLSEVSRVGHRRPSRAETVSLLRDEPNTAAALITGLLDFTRDARRLVSGDDDPTEEEE